MIYNSANCMTADKKITCTEHPGCGGIPKGRAYLEVFPAFPRPPGLPCFLLVPTTAS
jgi:hypothetical protein